ncbi:MAG: RraA family protein [Gammaproteobacteria bacterium]|nr:RraA family protein [Gammaproteobacteria bacterium]
MDAELKQALLELDCASLADADKSLRVMDVGLRAINTGVKLVGVARTVRCHEDFLAVIRALDAAQPGEVLVVDTQGSSRAVVGELFSMEAARRGLAGIIVDGPVRDVTTLRKLALPVYARGLCPMSGTIRELGALQVPVVCGGVAVNPGDIVLGDDDGLIVATAAELRALVPAARAIEARETVVRANIEAGRGLISMITLAEHVDALQRGEPSKLAFKLED